MARRLVLYGILVLSVALFFYQSRRVYRPAPEVTGASLEARGRGLLAIPETAERYRLTLDRRMPLAAQDLARIAGRPASDTASVQWKDGSWWVSAADGSRLVLKPMPSFGEILAALVEEARALHLPDSFPGRREVVLDRRSSIRAAHDADRQWSAGVRDRSLAAEGGHALVRVALESVDRVGASDAVDARALAWLAVRVAVDSTAVAADCALLAARMGYDAEACAYASALPPGDAVRAYVERDDEALRNAARSPASTEFARWLLLLRLAEANRDALWDGWRERVFPGPRGDALDVWSTSLALQRFAMRPVAAAKVFSIVMDDLRLQGWTGPATDSDFSSVRTVLDGFEAGMSRMPASADGVFLDRRFLESRYRTALYSAIWSGAEHARQSRAALPEAQAWAAALGEAGADPAGVFAGWYRSLVTVMEGQGQAGVIAHGIGSLAPFGAPLAVASHHEVMGLTQFGAAEQASATRRLAGVLDTRPRHRLLLAELVLTATQDVALAEDLHRAAWPALHPRESSWRVQQAAYEGDRTTLARLLDAPQEAREAVWGLDVAVESAALDSTSLDSLYSRLADTYPSNREAVVAAATWLGERGRDRQVVEILERWLEHPDPEGDSFDEIAVRVALSKAFERQGDLERAEAAVRPASESWQFGAMAQYAHVLSKRNRDAEAMKIATMAWKRYPDSPAALTPVLGILWKTGRFELAARAIEETRFPLGDDQWTGKLGTVFFESIPDAGNRRRAIASMSGGERGWLGLARMGTGLQWKGRFPEAFEILSQVHAPGANRFWAELSTFRCLERWKGREAALAWIRPRIARTPPAELPYWLMSAYAYEVDEVLWEAKVISADEDFTWLMRAAAWARAGGRDAGQRAQLERAIGRKSGRYPVLARYLLGIASEEEALATVVHPRSAGEVLYYVGLRAQAEGRIHDAARWYARCVEARQTYNSEHGWAQFQLIRWGSTHRSLDRIAREMPALAPPSMAAVPATDG